MGVTDPVTAGLVKSLAQPGANVTGVTNMAAILTGKRLELLKEATPKVSRVAVLWAQSTGLYPPMGRKPATGTAARIASFFDGSK
jgi:ABC-type uncharacterized transport system substrate-binding protein